MTKNFPQFAREVEANYAQMAKGELYVVDNDRDAIWEYYLAAFPDGSNPMYRQRTEHDCSCCKQFIRGIGNVVSISGGVIHTVWEGLADVPEPYATVARAMDLYVRQFPVKTLFRTKESRYGQARTLELGSDGKTIEWNHFEGVVDPKHFHREPATVKGEFNTNLGVFERGLSELKPEALEEVLDLIKDNNLYRGKEFEDKIRAFAGLQHAWSTHDEATRRMFALANVGNKSSLIRNTAIGTLLIDLSEGRDLESAVKAFEDKMSGTNYKRPKSLITKKMVEDAMKTVADLKLEPALKRRHATFRDVSVNNVLFVDGTVAKTMKDSGSLTDLLLEEVQDKPIKVDNPEQIKIEDFLESVVSKATSLDLLLSGEMQPNFMSVTAPVEEDVEPLFKWGNNFAWSYDGNVADSIKDRVKAAGGNVTNAKLRCSLSWWNTDDLDIHILPPSGVEIYYGSRGRPQTGQLDVDMNINGESTTPVENISWSQTPIDGLYQIVVDNFTKRNSTNVGCVIEIESNGKLYHFNYAKPLRRDTPIVNFTVEGGQIKDFQVQPGVTSTTISVEKWGVKTETLVKVNAVMTSPNHWDDNNVGNQHWFFMLEGVKNPEPVRGIYNEFLNAKLDKHRKVLEILGDKTKAPVSDEQLSGVGFSSTRSDKAVIVAKGPGLNKAYEVIF